MPVPNTMADLSNVAGDNYPVGSEPIGNQLDNYLRAHAALIRQGNSLASSSMPSGSTVNVANANGESVQITGSATISSLGAGFAGCKRELRFSGSPTLVHSASLSLPGAQDIDVQSGDVIQFRCLGAGVWAYTGDRIDRLAVRRTGDVMTGDLTSTAFHSTGSSATTPNYTASGGTFNFDHADDLSGSVATYRFGRSTVADQLHVDFFGPGSPAHRIRIIAKDEEGGGDIQVNGNSVWHAGNFTPDNQPASNIASGTLDLARIPNLPASRITSGTLPVARGGTGQSSLTSGNYLLGNGTSGVQTRTPAQVLSDIGGAGLGGNTFSGTQTATSTNSTNGFEAIAGERAIGLQAHTSQLRLNGTPGYPMHLRPNGMGDASGQLVLSNNGDVSVSGSITASGNVTAPNVTATSDRRLKGDISPSTPRRELLGLAHYRYKWKANGTPGIGVMAQDVRAVAPEHVHEAEDGVLSVDKAGLALEMIMALADKLEAR